MTRLFARYPEALAETIRFADRISFSLDQLKYQYPDEPVPPGKTANATLVEITMFPGRSLAAKKALYAAIVCRFETLGIAPSDVMIVLHEPPLDNWGLRGGRPASELDLGFNLNI